MTTQKQGSNRFNTGDRVFIEGRVDRTEDGERYQVAVETEEGTQPLRMHAQRLRSESDMAGASSKR